MTDTPTPRVTERSFNLWLQEAQEKASSPGVFLSWRDDLVLDYADSRALSQSQAATIAERDRQLEFMQREEARRHESYIALEAVIAERDAEIERLEAARIEMANDILSEREVNAALTERLARAEAVVSAAQNFVVNWGDLYADKDEYRHLRAALAAITPTKEP